MKGVYREDDQVRPFGGEEPDPGGDGETGKSDQEVDRAEHGGEEPIGGCAHDGGAFQNRALSSAKCVKQTARLEEGSPGRGFSPLIRHHTINGWAVTLDDGSSPAVHGPEVMNVVQGQSGRPPVTNARWRGR